MYRRLPPAILAIGVLALAAAGSTSSDYTDFSELDLEALLEQTIVTAARHTQKLRDAPVAATVITADEIAASGARSIPEVLRTVPGLDVIQATSSSFDVSARGLNKPGSNTMLVLVDGRSVYLDFYGVVVWDKLPISLEDIKVIEVIKGPGSAMHGANAFAGVINIITLTAAEDPGTTARTMVSHLGESYSSLRHAGRREGLSWKVSTAWDRSSDWRQDLLEAENLRFEGQARLDLSGESWLSVGAGHTDGYTRTFTPALLNAEGVSYYVRADYTHRSSAFRWFTNVYDAEIDPVEINLTGGVAVVKNRMHDFEMQHSLRPGRNHHILWGGSYRRNSTAFSQIEGDVDDDVYAGFMLEEWSPREDLRVSAGLRYEHHPLVGGNISPRGGIVFKPDGRHQLRLSYAKAYRNPSYIETYWWTEYDLPIDLPIDLPFELTQILRGDDGNKSEEIEAVELGYQGLLRECLLVTASLFQNRIDKLIQLHTVSSYPPPISVPREMAFQNGLSQTARGGEVSFYLDPRPWLRMGGQYSYVHLEDADTGERIESAPSHGASLTARIRGTQGQHLQLTGRYRSKSIWGGLTSDLDGIQESEERLVMDAAWQVLIAGGGHRVTVGVENLFDKRFRDHPDAIEQRRRWIASVAVNF